MIAATRPAPNAPDTLSSNFLSSHSTQMAWNTTLTSLSSAATAMGFFDE